MNRLLIYNIRNDRSHKDNVVVGDKYNKLLVTFEAIKLAMIKYKEMKREEMDKEENKDEDLIEYFREADEIEKNKLLGFKLPS